MMFIYTIIGSYNFKRINSSINKIMQKLNSLEWVAIILVIVGALNWALVGAFSFDLVAAIFGDMSWLSRIVYILVGLAGIYLAVIVGNLGKKASQM